ncbi:MAG: MipA/OmpV family protein [Desulfobacterales bacterium]|nr:MipA/OmpV family protein [Desulfobacterales bacterium]MBS3756323.1 MipA/OmpV family protein [Desulfobacterales bacterium]
MLFRIANHFQAMKFLQIFKNLKILRLCALLLIFFPAFYIPPAAGGNRSGQLPLWEFGLGAAPITMPAYRGSQTQEFYMVPMPYVIYRGDFLKIDREGIRGLLYDSPRLRVDLSADGAIPAASEEGDVREGMPDLDPVGEFGPSVNYLLHEGASTRMRLRLPVRAVFASDFTFIDHVGWKAHPQLNIDMTGLFGRWNIGMVLGPIFADRSYHDYYYEVAPRYASAARPAYRPEGGYSGTSLLLSASRRFSGVWVGMFARYDNLSGAAFFDSPLVETRHSFMGGIGIAWMLDRSDKTVPAEP